MYDIYQSLTQALHGGSDSVFNLQRSLFSYAISSTQLFNQAVFNLLHTALQPSSLQSPPHSQLIASNGALELGRPLSQELVGEGAFSTQVAAQKLGFQ